MDTPENDTIQPPRLTSISHSATYEEIGEFWDTHSGADFWDQMVEIQDWHTISEASLRRIWQNDQDAVYDEWQDLCGVSKSDETDCKPI